MQYPEEVQSEFGLHEQVTPQLEWELDIGGSEACQKIVFECMDGALGSIDPAAVELDKEPINILFLNVFFTACDALLSITF